jgi:hypothetical protein
MSAAFTPASGATPEPAQSTSPIPGTTRPPGAFRRLWRALKQLFYEAVGAIFGILAFAWLNNAFRAWTRGDVAHWLVALAVLVAAIFTLFAISSFRRARRI